jgi:hypothetical protein
MYAPSTMRRSATTRRKIHSGTCGKRRAPTAVPITTPATARTSVGVSRLPMPKPVTEAMTAATKSGGRDQRALHHRGAKW